MINDPIVFKTLSENVIEKVKSHPTTIVNSNLIISKLGEIRDYLINKGPLVMNRVRLKSSFKSFIDQAVPHLTLAILSVPNNS